MIEKKRILVADDDQQIVESIRKMLSVYYQVDIATTGIEALKMCKNSFYDGLIIDVEFDAGISGLETSELIRANNKEIKIIIFSATDYSNSIRQKAVDLGAVFYEKPLRENLIRKVLEEQI